MPNIEIHGFDFERANILMKTIFGSFEGKPYHAEMVVTIFPTVVKDAKGTKQPFIRLASSDAKHASEIIETLRTLNIDIEYLKLAKFIPKKPDRGEVF